MTLKQCFLLFVVLISCATSSFVTLNARGGYEKVIVAIDPEINKSHVESLLFRLEALFTEASKILHISTRGLAFFHEIVFLIPKILISSLPKKDFQDGRRYFNHPDFFVLQETSFENPFTIQHGSCGQPGLRIIVPQGYVFSNKDNKAQAVVREWAHYQYGVFDESGFLNDKLYPQHYTIPGFENYTQVLVNDCTNEDVAYEFRDKSGYLCNPNITNCEPVAMKQGDNIVSSLMMKLDFPKVSQFCDDKDYRHNRNSPTKQNALCREKSTWEVISQNPAFKTATDLKTDDVTPVFRYVVESEPRFILAVDSSNNMAFNGRIDLVRNAFSYFAFEDLPKDSLTGIVDLGRLDKEPLFFPVQTLWDVERLVDAFPDGEADSACVHCGILKAIQVLRQDRDNSVSSGTILLATSIDITNQWASNISETLASSDVTLFVIFFQNMIKHERPYLERIAISTGGKCFFIPESNGDGNIVSPLAILNEAFRTVYQSFSWMMRNHVLVDQRIFNNDETKHSMTFAIDKSITQLRVLITAPEFFNGPSGHSGPLIKDKTLLMCCGKLYSAGHKSYSYKMKIPAYMFSIENPQVGTWNLTFERRPGFQKPLIVFVRASNAEYTDMINVQGVVTEHQTILGNSTRRLPPVIYAEISKGHQPVTKAKVTAVVFQLQTGKTFELELRDNGNGDPDVTGNDGIYSKYFTESSVGGYHLVTIVVESDQDEIFDIEYKGITDAKHCCGSTIPPEVSYFPGNFKRVVTSGVFFIEDGVRGDLDYPPGRISDLHLTNVRIMEYNVVHYTLQWTAPGADLDSGTVTFYELKVFQSRDDALYRFSWSDVLTIDKWRIHGGPWLVPDPAGSSQNVIIELRNITSGIYFLAMRAADSAANVGEISNVVQVYLPPTTFPTMDPVNSASYSPSSPGGSTNINHGSTTSGGVNDRGALSPEVNLAIGITCGFLFLLLIAGFLLMVILGRRRKEKSMASRTVMSVLDHSSPKTESNDTLCRSTGGVSVITPVSSWPAGSLLAHYEKTRKASDATSHSDFVDNTSTSSTKYSYINRVDQNSSMYDSIYFHSTPEKDVLSYPFNPSYVPFSPSYTSSLRRDNHLNELSLCERSFDYYSATFDGRRPQRLKTDV